MIRLDAVTVIEHGRTVLNRVSFDFAPGIWHLADEHHGDARLLIDVLARHRHVATGAVRCGGARSWPLTQAASLGANLSGLDMIDMLASLYALERRATQRLFQDLFDDPEWLPVRFDRWPPNLQRRFSHIALLAPVFDVYLLDETSLVSARTSEMLNADQGNVATRTAANLRVRTIEAQIGLEQRQLAEMERAYAAKFYEYDRLKEDIEFAKNAYQNDLATLQSFHDLAAQQEVYLLRIFDPWKPDIALYPDWLLILPLTLIGGAMAYGLIRMAMALGRDKWAR